MTLKLSLATAVKSTDSTTKSRGLQSARFCPFSYSALPVRLTTVFSLLMCLVVASPVAAQPAATPASAPASRPVGDGELYWEVTEVQPKARIAPLGTHAVTGTEWRYVKVGDHLSAGQQIHTSWRSTVKLVARPASPPTVILIEGGTLMGVSQLAQLGETSKTRIELLYGAVRAGVAEGQVRSDMEIRCPVATLSKRGTDIFRFEYLNGRFRMSLSEQGRGMLRALQLQYGSRGNLLRSRSRFVTAGQFVTQRMAMAIDNVKFNRNINMNDPFGLIGNDQLFTLLNSHGLAFLLPQGKNLVNMLDSPTQDGGVPGETDGLDADGLNQPLGQVIRQGREGVFGIGQGIVPSIFGSDAKRRLQEVRNRCRGLGAAACKQQQLKRLGRRR